MAGGSSPAVSRPRLTGFCTAARRPISTARLAGDWLQRQPPTPCALSCDDIASPVQKAEGSGRFHPADDQSVWPGRIGRCSQWRYSLVWLVARVDMNCRSTSALRSAPTVLGGLTGGQHVPIDDE